MDNLVFMVQGSAIEPYKVVFSRLSATVIAVYCDCPAGGMGIACKHRLNIINGKTKGIVSGNEGQVAEIAAWLPGSDIERAIAEVVTADELLDHAKDRLFRAKRELARTMQGIELSGQ